MGSVLTRVTGGVVFAMAITAGSATADVIATFGYTDLNGRYVKTSATTGNFTARADDVVMHTGGDVTRLSGPGGTAQFDTGFDSLGTFADVLVSLSVSVVTPGSLANGAGTIVLTDVDGDTMTGDIAGIWQSPGGGIVFYSGVLSNVFFNDNGAGDGTFDGISGGFGMDLPGDPPYTGAFSQLYIRFTGGFFTNNFNNQTVSADGQIVPAPGALALLGVAGLVARRRRA